MAISRRTFLTSMTMAGAAAFGGTAFLARQRLHATFGSELQLLDEGAGYGALAPRQTNNTGETLLALPQGFQYKVIGRGGSPMNDGRTTPRLHDGMAAFLVDGKIRLVRNHEIRDPVIVPLAPESSYDQKAGGGTTTLIVDPVSRDVELSFVSLSGTVMNCAGGPTPWGSWISCEESVAGRSNGFAQPHGYCFEVSARSAGPVESVPLRAMGRFVHEAAAIDPLTGFVYLTEDRDTAGLYRFIPNVAGRLSGGGRLQMLAVSERPNYDTRRAQRAGEMLAVRWVDIADPDPTSAESNSLAVYQQGVAAGGATFARLEGAWFAGASLFVVSTTGGDRGKGQVWEYRLRSPYMRRRPVRLSSDSAGFLRLLFESPGAEVLDMPDNVCGSPRGGLLLCEDGSDAEMLRGLTLDGRLFDFARNVIPGFEGSEFCGSTFSPDGETLFVNVQGADMTFAIWGPWAGGGL